MLRLLERTGAVVIESIREMGRMGIFFSSFLIWAFRRPLKLERITQQVHFIGVKSLGVSDGSYFSQMEVSVVFRDVYTGVIKSFCFGALLTWVCCYKGYYAGHGAAGVSKATTEAVVLASVLILVLDYFLTSIL